MPVTLPFGELRGGSAGRQKSSVQNDFTHTHPSWVCHLASFTPILCAHSWPFFSVIYKPHYRHKPGSAHTDLEKYRLSSCTLDSAPGLHIPFCVQFHTCMYFQERTPGYLNTDRRECQQELVKFPKASPYLQEMCPTLSCWGWRKGTPGLIG